MEKEKEESANANIEADLRCRNNRNLYLMTHKYHESLLAKVLEKEIEKLEEKEDETTGDFNVGEFLRTKIFEQIIQIQVLVFGNTAQAEAEDFWQKHIVERFDVLDPIAESEGYGLEIGTLHAFNLEAGRETPSRGARQNQELHQTSQKRHPHV